MNRKKFLLYILTFFIIALLLLPVTQVFAVQDEPTVNAPVALLMDARYW